MTLLVAAAWALDPAVHLVLIDDEPHEAEFGVSMAPLPDGSLLVGATNAAAQLERTGAVFLVSMDADPVKLVAHDGQEADHFGWAVATGDFDGDGQPDLAASAPYQDSNPRHGKVYLAYDGDSEFQILTAPVVQEKDQFGWSMTAGDVDGDGLDDLAVGVPHDGRDELNHAGAVWLYSGADGGLTTPSAQHLVAEPRVSPDHLGVSVAIGDINGDGYQEVGSGAHWQGEDPCGAVIIWMGSAEGMGPPEWVLQPESCGDYDYFGESLAFGDMNGDGRDDLAVGAPQTDLVAWDTGSVHIFRAGPFGIGDERVIPQTSTAEAYMGTSVTFGDLDGDGLSDVVVGAPGMGVRPGQLTIVWADEFDMVRSVDKLANPDDETSRNLGRSVATVDWDGDGWLDIAGGAPKRLRDEQDGAVWIFELFGSPPQDTDDPVTPTDSDPPNDPRAPRVDPEATCGCTSTTKPWAALPWFMLWGLRRRR